jgi:hypothetical protein
MCYFILDKNGKTITSIEADDKQIAIDYGKEIKAEYITYKNTVIKI